MVKNYKFDDRRHPPRLFITSIQTFFQSAHCTAMAHRRRCQSYPHFTNTHDQVIQTAQQLFFGLETFKKCWYKWQAGSQITIQDMYTKTPKVFTPKVFISEVFTKYLPPKNLASVHFSKLFMRGCMIDSYFARFFKEKQSNIAKNGSKKAKKR